MQEVMREQIRQRLEDNGTTQASLARDMGIEKQQLNDYLSGRRGMLTGMAERILDQLGLDIVLIERKK